MMALYSFSVSMYSGRPAGAWCLNFSERLQTVYPSGVIKTYDFPKSSGLFLMNTAIGSIGVWIIEMKIYSINKLIHRIGFMKFSSLNDFQ